MVVETEYLPDSSALGSVDSISNPGSAKYLVSERIWVLHDIRDLPMSQNDPI